MSEIPIFNYMPPLPKKPVSKHPWQARIKPENVGLMKYTHNSTSSNPRYPRDPKNTGVKDSAEQRLQKLDPPKKDKFTLYGVKFIKEFIYCRQWIKSLRKYRPKLYDEPLIKGVTTIEWPKLWKDLKREYSESYCINSPVIVLLNGEYLGGHEHLKEHLEKKFTFHFILDYTKEAIKEFSNLLNSTRRPFVYMHISVDEEPLGTLIFMLYTDIVPLTCANFMRLCQKKKCGYAGTSIHRIVKDCWVQCGGFTLKSTDMKCENFIVNFDKRGVLAMANAERHVDCSTQFFIISQPSPWMKENYVAFGQLIEGESTFKAIEDTPTWYESPVKDIKIFKAGVINLDCAKPRAINKNARHYINSHIENMYEAGEYFYEALLERVFTEIQLKYLKSLERSSPNAGEHEEEASLNEEKIRAAHRFVHKKSALDYEGEEEENNDFDVDTYEYEPEGTTISQIETASPVIKPDIPFYFPLNDVPYPDEVDSNFDMKRFIKGRYCLLSDVRKHVPRNYLRSPRGEEDAEILDAIMSSSSSDSSMDFEAETELYNYISTAGEKMSVSGAVIRRISRSLGVRNILKYFYSHTIRSAFGDEELRKARLLDADFKISKQRAFQRRAVSLTVCQDHIDRKIRRRPTGFLRDEDVIKMIKARIKAGIELDDYDDEDEDDDDDQPDDDRLEEKRKRSTKIIVAPTPSVIGLKHRSILKEKHQSTIHRLYSDVAMDEGEKPTLKDYRVLTASDRDLKKPSLFLTESNKVQMSDDSINYIRSEKRHHVFETLQLTEVVEEPTIKIKERSIRSHQFARMRPSLTVEQYQEKNKPTPPLVTVVKRKPRPQAADEPPKKSGIRLPGDSPLYSLTSIKSNESHKGDSKVKQKVDEASASLENETEGDIITEGENTEVLTTSQITN